MSGKKENLCKNNKTNAEPQTVKHFSKLPPRRQHPLVRGGNQRLHKSPHRLRFRGRRRRRKEIVRGSIYKSWKSLLFLRGVKWEDFQNCKRRKFDKTITGSASILVGLPLYRCHSVCIQTILMNMQ